MDGHIGCFCIMAIINNTAMKNTETLYKYAKCGLFFQLLPESYCIYKKGRNCIEMLMLKDKIGSMVD